MILDYPDPELSNGKKESTEVPTEEPTTINTTPIPTVSDTSCPPNSCSQRWKPWPTCAQSTPEDEQKLSEALSRFSLEFYKIAVQKNDGNMVFSPLSIITTFSNLLLGKNTPLRPLHHFYPLLGGSEVQCEWVSIACYTSE